MKNTLLICLPFLMATGCHQKSHNKSSFPPASILKDSGFIAPVVLSDSGWVSLMEGNTLSAWHTYGRKSAGSAWNVDSGAIHLKTGHKNGYQTEGGGDLISNDSFSNFALKLEWMIGKKANSGIMIYVQDNPVKFKETWNTGPEIQVCDKDSNEDAHIPKHEPGDIYDLIASRLQAARPAMEWNQVEIMCNQSRLDVYLNDVHVISTALWDEHWKKLIFESKFRDMPGFGMFHSGHIALQDHGEEVWYRNVRIKKIE